MKAREIKHLTIEPYRRAPNGKGPNASTKRWRANGPTAVSLPQLHAPRRRSATLAAPTYNTQQADYAHRGSATEQPRSEPVWAGHLVSGSPSTFTASRSGRSWNIVAGRFRSTRRSTAVDTSAEYVLASATVVTRRTCRRGRPRWEGVDSVRVRGRAARTPSTAGRRGCSFPATTSGRARSGCAASNCDRTTRPDSGRATATTTMGTRGKNSDTGATELAARAGLSRA